jgi:hypothetical protein
MAGSCWFTSQTGVQSFETVYFLKDHLGSIRATVDENADVVGYDDYDPWRMIMYVHSMVSTVSGSQGIIEKFKTYYLLRQ